MNSKNKNQSEKRTLNNSTKKRNKFFINVKSFSFYEKILESVKAFVLITDNNFNILYCSESSKNIIGFNAKELINGSIKLQNILSREEHSFFDKKLLKKLELKKIVSHKTKIINKKGKTIIALCKIQQISLENTKEKKYLFIFLDETHHEKKIEDLLKEHHFFNVLMNNMPDTIYFKDTRSRFTLINESQRRLLGAAKIEDAIGKTDFDFFTPEHAAAAFEDEQQIIKTGKPLIYKIEKVRRGENGKFIWVSATKVPVFDSKNRIKGIVGISRDITQFKEAEDQLRILTEELKLLNETKDKLFSIIAHDLRNPFISLLGISHLIVEEYNELSEDEKLEYIAEIEKSAKSAYDLLENLLYWSRSQTNNITCSPQEIDIREIIEKNIRLLSTLAASKKINIINNVKNETLAYADLSMIDIVIRNLISNAIKFTPELGEIKIESHHNDDYVSISVIDSGIGMSSEKIEKLMKYNQINSSLGTNKEKGTGLGLILCKDFIEKNNGKLFIESEIGKGTKITFTLPMLKS